MGAMDIAVIAAVAAVILGALRYILREKKRGKKCVGCPYSGCCSGKGSGCGSSEESI